MADRVISRWAENAAAGDKADPGLAQELTGYLNLQKPPHDEFNYLMSQVSGRPYVFSTASDAAAELPVGKMGIVDEDALGVDPLTGLWTFSDVGTDVSAACVACDGRYVYVGYEGGSNESKFRLLDRETGVQGGGFDFPNAEDVRSIHSDGGMVFVAHGDWVSAYNVPANIGDTMLPAVWEFDHGAAVNAVYSDGNRLFMGGVSSGGVLTRSRVRSTGVSDWDNSDANPGPINALASNGRYVYVCGPGVGVTLRRLRYDTGVSLHNYDHGAETYDLALGRESVFICGADSAGDRVRRLNLALVVDWSTSGLGSSIHRSIVYDGDRLWVGGDRVGSRTLVGIDPVLGETDAFEFDHGASADVQGLATDGFGLFAAIDIDANDDLVHRHSIDTTPRLVRRMAGTERYGRPYHNALMIVGADQRI